jgi:hypothetical protein
MNSKQIFLRQSIASGVVALSLVLTAHHAAADSSHSECPNEVVNFWKNFALDNNNPDAIPGFLLTHDCMRSTSSTEFYTTTLQRLDHPDKEEFVHKLYAKLGWGSEDRNPVPVR